MATDSPAAYQQECDGSRECEAEVHVHGCFADFGKCDEPDEHGGYRDLWRLQELAGGKP